MVLQGQWGDPARTVRAIDRACLRGGWWRRGGDGRNLHHWRRPRTVSHRHGYRQRVLRPQFEKRNYLNLAGSKLRTCSVGPELVVGAGFQSIDGEVRIQRGGETIWSKKVETGEANMCHSLVNLEHHHFKFECHRQPGDVHVHFFGAHSLSFGDGIGLLGWGLDGSTL